MGGGGVGQCGHNLMCISWHTRAFRLHGRVRPASTVEGGWGNVVAMWSHIYIYIYLRVSCRWVACPAHLRVFVSLLTLLEPLLKRRRTHARSQKISKMTNLRLPFRAGETLARDRSQGRSVPAWQQRSTYNFAKNAVFPSVLH